MYSTQLEAGLAFSNQWLIGIGIKSITATVFVNGGDYQKHSPPVGAGMSSILVWVTRAKFWIGPYTLNPTP